MSKKKQVPFIKIGSFSKRNKKPRFFKGFFLRLAQVRFRFLRRLHFKIMRLAVFSFFRLWIDKIVGFHNIPVNGSVIFVSNHLSYYDFLIFGAMMRSYIVFLAQKKINETFFIRWFTKLHNVVFVDKDYPGYSFFKELMRHLKNQRHLLIYPEGSRSRTGKMFRPKIGFVKLALLAGVPVVPLTMKGTYEILPPHKRVPVLRRCKVVIGKKVSISPDNPAFHDIFLRQPKELKPGKLSDEAMEEIAVRIMNDIRILAGQEWDDSIAHEMETILKRRG